MVSGLVTSPKELSRISSGDASPIVIFVKLLFIFESFLKQSVYIFLVFHFADDSNLMSVNFSIFSFKINRALKRLDFVVPVDMCSISLISLCE